MSKLYVNLVDYISDVYTVTNASSPLKMELFKASIEHNRVQDYELQKYIAKVNSIMSKYSQISERVVQEMRSFSDTERARSIPYADMKPFLYANYDYASAIAFLDGLYKGIDEGKIKNQHNIDTFFEHTVSMAFKDLPTSTAALADFISNINMSEMSEYEIKKFKAVSEQKIFNNSDSRILYKSIRAVIDYLSKDVNDGFNLSTDDITMKIAFFVNAIEYLNYSVIAYISRVYVITKYVQGFMEFSDMISESTNVSPMSISNMKVDVMIPADDIDYREPATFPAFAKLLSSFAGMMGTSIGGVDFINRIDNDYFCFRIHCNPHDNVKNMFADGLIANPLYEFILNRIGNSWGLTSKQRQAQADEFGDLVHNKNMALSTSISAKQQMLAIIRDVNKDEYTAEVVHDLCEFALEVTSAIKNAFVENVRQQQEEQVNAIHNNATLNALAEMIREMKGLYEEIVGAVLYRLRDIEMHHNIDKQSSNDRVFAALSMDIPTMKNDVSHTHDTMVGVPDTARIPLELYAQPEFESLQMYDEYVKSLPGMGNDAYFTEAVDFSKIINTLLSLVNTWYKKSIQFFDGPNFKAASEWVTRNKSMLQGASYEGKTIEVLPYKDNISYPSVDKFIDKVKSGFNNDNLSSQEKLDTYINSLYDLGDTTIANILKSTDKNSGTNLENYVLFGVQPGGTVQTKTLNSDAEIKGALRTWISTVEGGAALRTSFINTQKKAELAIKSFKLAVSEAPVSTSTTTNSTPTSNPPSMSGSNNPDTNEEKANNNNEPVNNDNFKQQAITQVQAAFQKIVFPSYTVFHKAILDQYSYIKTCYDNANK